MKIKVGIGGVKIDASTDNQVLIKGWSEKYNLILIHNPKVAGTSLMTILENSNVFQP